MYVGVEPERGGWGWGVGVGQEVSDEGEKQREATTYLNEPSRHCRDLLPPLGARISDRPEGR
jgi:hypothetical protein